MKQLFIIANWKSHAVDSLSWLKEVSDNLPHLSTEKEIIICPSFTLLEKVSWFIGSKSLSSKIGAQDISRFDEGAFTGEVNGKQLKEVASYVIIGHSERREKLGETDDDISKKVTLSLKYSLTPIVCVQNENTPIPQNVEIVAYEPIFAIGSGTPDTPENADEVSRKIKEKNSVKHVIYGGSVTPENVNSFTQKENINGVLVGSKSLDPMEFARIVKNA